VPPVPALPPHIATGSSTAQSADSKGENRTSTTSQRPPVQHTMSDSNALSRPPGFDTTQTS
jgi:hypothetical protein